MSYKNDYLDVILWFNFSFVKLAKTGKIMLNSRVDLQETSPFMYPGWMCKLAKSFFEYYLSTSIKNPKNIYALWSNNCISEKCGPIFISRDIQCSMINNNERIGSNLNVQQRAINSMIHQKMEY